MKSELIVVEQLPIIKARLEQISTEIKEKVDRANALVVNEDTVKEVKQVRASLTKEFNELETQRKQVKSAIMAKYDEFEEIYKENVSELYKQADAELKEKIDSVENQLKQVKEDELREFVKQHIEANNLQNIIKFENIGRNITLSASMKSLKEQALAFIQNVANDVKLIELEEYKDEILIEYINNIKWSKKVDFTQSKLNIIERHKQLEEIKKQQEEKEELQKQEEEVIEKVEEITIPKKIEDEEDVEEEFVTCSFTVKATRTQLKKLKAYLESEGITYE